MEEAAKATHGVGVGESGTHKLDPVRHGESPTLLLIPSGPRWLPYAMDIFFVTSLKDLDQLLRISHAPRPTTADTYLPHERSITYEGY